MMSQFTDDITDYITMDAIHYLVSLDIFLQLHFELLINSNSVSHPGSPIRELHIKIIYVILGKLK